MNVETEKPLCPEIALALVHYPCYNQHGETVCTNVTNFDIHDIARSSRSFGVNRYYIVNRVREQQMFVHRVLDHWRVGEGSQHNPMRKTAIEMVNTAGLVEEAIDDMTKIHGVRPLIIGTSAQNRVEYKQIGFNALRELIWHDRSRPTLLLFGTGWGMTDQVLAQCDFMLDPIRGSSPDDHRHLSVRAAVAVALDRLLGQ